MAKFDPDAHATGKNAFKLTDVKWVDVSIHSLKMKYRHHQKKKRYTATAIAHKWCAMSENDKRRWFLEHVVMVRAGKQAAISDDDEPTGSDLDDSAEKREKATADKAKAREEKKKSAKEEAKAKAVAAGQQQQDDDDDGGGGGMDYGGNDDSSYGEGPGADDDDEDEDEEVVVDESMFRAWLKGWRADEAKKIAAAKTKGKGKGGKSMKSQSEAELRELFISTLRFEPRPRPSPKKDVSKKGGSKGSQAAATKKTAAAAKGKEKQSLAETRATAQSISFDDVAEDSNDDNLVNTGTDVDRHEDAALSKRSLWGKNLKRPSQVKKRKFAPLKAKAASSSAGAGAGAAVLVAAPAASAAAPAKAPAGRNKRRPWTAEEECALIGGVSRYGDSMWTSILACAHFGSALSGRTNVNLKDKYRTMCKSGDLVAL